MDHPLAAFDPAARPWRAATLVATGVAAIELVLLVVAGSALLARHASTSASRRVAPAKTALADRASAPRRATPRPRSAHPRSAPRLARGRVSVLVLNGNGRSGAASAAARRVRSRGYRIGGVGNAGRMNYGRSMVMYRPGFEAEGRRLAHDLGISLVGPLDGLRPPQLRGAQAVLVVGR